MPTIRDVAKHAGVAPITVSRVINNSGPVSEGTRERVIAAIADLGYVPNTLARSLRFKRTNTLGLVLTDITNPFWTTVARGVEDVSNELGFTVMLCNTDESEEKQARYLDVLLQKQVDGILLVPASSEHAPIDLIQKQEVPVVVMDRRVPCAQVDVVRCNSEGGAYRLVRLLLELGHRQIAAINGPETVSTAADRIAGYLRALTDGGLSSNAAQAYHGEFTLTSGYEMTQRALAATPPPTALFAGNNFIAIGALRALRDAGFRVPGDIALVSFDDLPSELVVDPFLTVAAQPAYEMGRCATELLFARLHEHDDQTLEPFQEIVLETELIVRASSGGPLWESHSQAAHAIG